MSPNDLRAAVVKRAAQEVAVCRAHFDRAAVLRLALNPFHFAGKNPGMSRENTVAYALVQDQSSGMRHQPEAIRKIRMGRA